MKRSSIVKVLCLLTALAMCASIAGCGGGAATTTAPAAGATTAAPAATTAAAAAEPETTAAAAESEPAGAVAPEATTAAATTAAATTAATTAAAEPVAPANEVVTLQMFSMPSNTSGIMENSYWTDILARDLGIQLDLMPAGDQGEQKLAALMAAHDFPDLVVLKSYKNVVDAVAANLLICLDDYQTELANTFANVPSAVQYFRDNVSNGTGKLYAVANNISTVGATVGDTDFGPYLRWDLYKQIGMPEMNTWEDLIPVLLQMQEAHPVNEDGQKVYGISLWTDWDDTSMQSADDFNIYYGHGRVDYCEINYSDNSIGTIFDETSNYKRYLKYLFNANKAGLIDPDSLTQRWNDYLDKQTAGRALFSYWSWGWGDFNTPDRAEQMIGGRPIIIKDLKMERSTGPEYIGGIWPTCIGVNTKNLELCLKYINYMSSYDGIWAMSYGDQGVYWDVDEGGPYMTEFGWQMYQDPTVKFPNGGRTGDGVNVTNNGIISSREINPKYGVTISTDGWQKKDFAPPDSNLLKDWKETMRAFDGTIAWYKSMGMMIERDFAPMEPISDEVDQIKQRIGDTVKTLSWQMVFANDEAEFNGLWEAMTERAKGMNVDTVVEETTRLYNSALAFGSKYMY